MGLRGIGGGAGGARGARSGGFVEGALQPNFEELCGVSEAGARLSEVVEEATLAAGEHELAVEGQRVRQPIHILQPPPVSLQEVEVVQHQEDRLKVVLEPLVVQLPDAPAKVTPEADLRAQPRQYQADVRRQGQAPDVVVDHLAAPLLELKMLHHRLDQLAACWAQLADDNDRPAAALSRRLHQLLERFLHVRHVGGDVGGGPAQALSVQLGGLPQSWALGDLRPDDSLDFVQVGEAD
eukprot:764227-Hanusia_phi.AAC.1